LSEAQANLASAQALHRLALQNAAAAVTAAQTVLTEAQEALAEGQAGGDALEVAKAGLAIKTAEVGLAVAQADRVDLTVGPAATALAAAQADVAKKQLAVADAVAALAATEVRAPFDGTVLEVNVGAGDLVSNGATLLTLANLDALEVLASVDETTVRSVAAGQPAQVTFDALPGQTLNGVVGEVPLQGTLQGGVTVYEVPVSLAGAEQLPLLVGMTANVKIATGEARDALLVPTMALTKANGMYQVLVADPLNPNAEPQAAPVQVGLSDGTYTQITAGLNEGDQVVVEMSASTGTTGNRNFRVGGGMFGIPGFGR
jgi:HlyD family secretion protein